MEALPTPAIKPLAESKDGLVPQTDSYKRIFERISNLSPGDIVVRSNCKFCNHPIRFEAESRYEMSNRTSLAVVERLFRDYERDHPDYPTMTYIGIQRHLHNHYVQQEKEIYLREYIDRLTEYMNCQIDQDKQLQALLKSCELRFHEVAASPQIDPIKQVDAMTKLSKSVLDIMTMQAKLRGDVNLVDVVSERFKSIWTEMISNESDDRIRTHLISALDAFQRGAVNNTLSLTQG